MAEDRTIAKHNELPLASDWYEGRGFRELIMEGGWEAAGITLALSSSMWRKPHNALAFSGVRSIAHWFHFDYQKLLRVIELGLKTGIFESLNLPCSNTEPPLQLSLSKAQAHTRQSRQDNQDSQVDQDNQKATHFHAPYVTAKYREYEARIAARRMAGGLGGRKAADNRPPLFPPELNSPECRQAWRDWVEHKKTKGKGYKSVKSQEAMLKQKAKLGAERFCSAIQFSMGSNYDGIFEEKSGNGARSFTKPTTWDLNKVKLEEIAKRERDARTEEARRGL